MIKRKDLVDIGDADFAFRRDEFMKCQDCGEVIGGTRGDFFMLSMEGIFYCTECESTNIAIVKIVEKTVIVKQ